MTRALYSTIVLLFGISLNGFTGGDKNKEVSKVLTNDHYFYISTNQIWMFASNNGDGSHNPNTDGQGLYWPGGTNGTQGAVFEDGLVWGGMINNEKHVGGSTYRHGLQAGKILPDGTADDPSLEKYRLYKVRIDWENLPPGPERDQYEQDYNEWPAEDGAPFNDVNNDGIYTPGIDNPYLGDQTLWCVSNDLDPSRTTFLYGTMPMGLEVQTLIYGYNETGFLGSTVFKKYKIINKGQNTIEDMYLSYWADDDLGDGTDDYTGCDIGLKLGYTYNGNFSDPVYGSPPPAVGHMLVQGPIVPGDPADTAYFNNEWRSGYRNLPMTSFAFFLGGSNVYQDPEIGVTAGTDQMYNYIRGLIWDGSPFIDPNTNTPTVYPLSGDPVSGLGWYEGEGWPGGPAPGDMRNLISSGPFTLAPGDTQEVVIAIFLEVGTSNILSVSSLKDRALEIQNYYGAFNITGIENVPVNNIDGFELSQNYPNPFNPVTSIQYKVGSKQFVKLKVYNVLGREVAVLVNEEKPAGSYSVEFDGSNLSSGVYFCRMKAGKYTATRKLLLLK